MGTGGDVRGDLFLSPSVASFERLMKLKKPNRRENFSTVVSSLSRNARH